MQKYLKIVTLIGSLIILCYGCYLAYKKGKNDHYFLGTKKNSTVLSIAKLYKTKIKMVPSRPGERLGSIQKNDKAFRELGYEVKIDIKEYVKNYVNKSRM